MWRLENVRTMYVERRNWSALGHNCGRGKPLDTYRPVSLRRCELECDALQPWCGALRYEHSMLKWNGTCTLLRDCGRARIAPGRCHRPVATCSYAPAPARCEPAPAGARQRVLALAHHRRALGNESDELVPDAWLRRRSVLRRRLQAEEGWAWVGKLPCAAQLSVSLCLRGLRCTDIVPSAAAQMRPAAVHSCYEEPGGRQWGTESVCAFRFAIENHNRSDWDGVFFALNDDIASRGMHIAQYKALKSFLSANEWPRWPEAAAQLSERECGCSVVTEDLRKGRYRFFDPIQWMLRDWVNHTAGSESISGPSFIWPQSFIFHVDSDSVRMRSLRWLLSLYRLAQNGLESADTSAVEPLIWPSYLGYVIERLPFFLFGRSFREAPSNDREPRCSSAPYELSARSVSFYCACSLRSGGGLASCSWSRVGGEWHNYAVCDDPPPPQYQRECRVVGGGRRRVQARRREGPATPTGPKDRLKGRYQRKQGRGR